MSLGSRRHEHKLCEGAIKYKMSSGHTWKSAWGVLEGKTIYLYANKHKVKENCLNIVDIVDDGLVHVKRYDKRKGYRFVLSTQQKQVSFSTETMSHREQWRAYIIGLTTGKVPRDADLLSDEVHKIQSDLDLYITRCDSNRLSTATKDSGLGASLDGSCLDEQRSTTAVDRECSEEWYSWYFGYCTREEAEIMLTNGVKCREFEHFKVDEVDSGYRIDVRNTTKYGSLNTLYEVMECFVHVSGGPMHTRPMTTNDPKLLGYIKPHYATKIPEASTKDEPQHKAVVPLPLPPPLPCRGTNTLPRHAPKDKCDDRFKTLGPNELKLGTIPKFKQELASLFAGLRVGQAGVPRADKTSGPRADKTSGPCVDLFGNDLHGSVFDSYETDDHIYAEPDDVDD